MLRGVNADIAYPILARRPKIPQGPHVEGLTGKCVMVTGAGGSIGSELVVQIAAAAPHRLVMVDNSEFALYEIDSTIRQEAGWISKETAVCDVRDMDALRRLFDAEKPHVVFHAAALKHVPLLETEHNLIEAIHTNVVGTMNVADLCLHYGARLVLISTDKAVFPESTMGRTKRLAELYVQSLSERTGLGTFAQVRFGNVIGSSGSVIPLFRRQIAQGGPITITHTSMTRYMMSIQEAVKLVLDAASIQATHRDGCGLYVLDMGEPVRILDLAKQLMRFAGVDLPIEVIGLRPGEKLAEELTYPWEKVRPTSADRVLRADPPDGLCILAPHMRATCKRLMQTREAAAARDFTCAIIEENVRTLLPQADSVAS